MKPTRFHNYSSFLEYSSLFPQRRHYNIPKAHLITWHGKSETAPVCFYSVLLVVMKDSWTKFKVWSTFRLLCKKYSSFCTDADGLKSTTHPTCEPPLCPAKWRIIKKTTTIQYHYFPITNIKPHRRCRHKTQVMEEDDGEHLVTLPVSHQTGCKYKPTHNERASNRRRCCCCEKLNFLHNMKRSALLNLFLGSIQHIH